MEHVSTYCRQLKTLCISGCSQLTDATLVRLGEGCHDLKTLEVAECTHFTDNGFQALARVRQICNSIL